MNNTIPIEEPLAVDEPVVAEESDVHIVEEPQALTIEETIMQHGRRSDGEVVVTLNEEQIKAKHDQFHEIYRKQVLDTYQFRELSKEFSARKKLRETDMAQLDNCILRGEETQCVTRWRIPAHKLTRVLPFETNGAEEEAFIFDSDFNLIDRVPLTEMERQLQIEYEDNDSETAPVVVEGVSEVPEAETAEPMPDYITFKEEHVQQNY